MRCLWTFLVDPTISATAVGEAGDVLRVPWVEVSVAGAVLTLGVVEQLDVMTAESGRYLYYLFIS